jgi:hypothetical protein
MYFPDKFADLTALSDGVHRFVVRWWGATTRRQIPKQADTR